MLRLSNAERNQAVGMLQAGQSKRAFVASVLFYCPPPWRSHWGGH